MDATPSLALTREAVADIRAVLAVTDLDAPVPACPGWDLLRLARHVGEIHRWVRGAVLEGYPDTVVPEGPADRDALLTWYDEGAEALLDVLAGADPDAPCWHFGPPPSTVRFWLRRMPHEHTVHAWDAVAAQGGARPVPPALALDGIDEVVHLFFPRQVRLGRVAPLSRSLALAPDGADRTWVLAGAGTDDVPAASAEATLTGPAEALYLLLWGRIAVDDPRLSFTGDPAAVAEVLITAVVP